MIPLRLRMRQYLLLPILFGFVLEVLARTMTQQKEMKSIKIANEEIKLSNYSHNRIVHVHNLKKSTDKFLEIVSEFRYKVKFKNQLCFCIRHHGADVTPGFSNV